MAILNLNGVQYSTTSARIIVAGVPYRGVNALSWKAESPKTEKYGVGRHSIGYVRGPYKASATLEIIKAQGDRLLSDLNKIARVQEGSASASYMDAEFNIEGHFKEAKLGLSTAEIRGAVINSVEEALAAEGLMYKIELLVSKSLRRVVNGELIEDMPDDEELVPAGIAV